MLVTLCVQANSGFNLLHFRQALTEPSFEPATGLTSTVCHRPRLGQPSGPQGISSHSLSSAVAFPLLDLCHLISSHPYPSQQHLRYSRTKPNYHDLFLEEILGENTNLDYCLDHSVWEELEAQFDRLTYPPDLALSFRHEDSAGLLVVSPIISSQQSSQRFGISLVSYTPGRFAS